MNTHALFFRSSESLREKRLLLRNVEVLPDQVLETFLQPNQNVEQMEQAVGKLDEQSPVYQAMVERSKSLSEDQRKVIDSNCERLRKETQTKAETLQKISLLQKGINTTPQIPTTPASATEPNALERAWKWTTDKTQAGWERTKEFAAEHPTLAIAVGSTLGVGLIYKLWKWWRGEKKEENAEKKEEKPAEKESTFWKVVKWIPGVGLMALVGWGVYEGVKWMKGNLGSLDQMKALLANAENRLKSMVGLGNKAEQYGMSEENYHKAVHAYREVYQENPEKGAAIIRSIFGLKDGETSPDHQKFMENMGKKFERKHENGILYAHADVAIENYEQHFESALKHLEQWIVEHRYEALFAAYIANRFGLLLPIIRGGGSAAVRAVKISKEMLTWGISHPIISLFAAGGAVLGMRAAVKAGKELWMPENFKQLGKAISENKRILLPADESAILEKLEELKDYVVEFARSGGDFGPWVLKKLGEYVKELDENVPKLLGASREKIVFENNSAGLGNLQRWLEERKENAPTDTEDIQSKIGEKCDSALAQLAAFQTVFLADRCGAQVVSGNRPQQALKPLRQSLDALQITLVAGADGILRWKQQSGNAIDLCVNPAVTSKDEIFRISNRMRFGEESGLSHFCSRIVQYGRLLLGEGTEIGKKIPFAGRSDVVAMVVGPSLYVADLRHIQDFVIFKVPIDMVAGLWNEPTWWDKAATVATGMAETGLFSLSASVLGTTIKRLAVGGGPIFRFNAGEIIQGSIPFWAQWKMLRDTYRGSKDVSLMKNFISEYQSGSGILNRFSGYRRAWYISTVLGKAGVKNIAWVGIIENAKTIQELDNVAGKLNLTHLIVQKNGVYLPIKEARTVLKKRILDKIKVVKMREWSLRNGLRRLAVSGEVLDGSEIWNDVLTWYNAKAGLPPPLPVAPPPVSGGAAVPPPPARPSGVPPPPASPTTPSTTPSRPSGSPGKTSVPAGSPASAPRTGSTPSTPRTSPAPSQSPQSQPASSRTTGTSETERMPGNNRTRNAPPSSVTHEPLPADVQGKAEKALAGMEADIARAAEGSEGSRILRSSPEVRKILAKTPLDPKLIKLADDSPEFARFLSGHLRTSVQAEKIVSELNASAKTVEDISFIGRIMSTEKGCGQVIKAIEAGKPAAEALARASKVSRVFQALKFAGKSVPVAGDAGAIFASVLEWFDTSSELQRLRASANPNPEVIRLTEQKYYYIGAEGVVSGTGAIAGGCLLVGSGGTVAAPVLAVTLPISIAIGASYAAHKVTIDETRTVADWRDVPLPQRFAALRTYSLTERAGHTARELVASAGASEMGSAGAQFMMDSIEGNILKKQQTDERKIRSIIEETTTVQIPTIVRDANGTERAPNAVEVAQYQEEIKRYVDARVQFFLSQRVDRTHAVRTGDIIRLIENSEYAGQLAKDRPVLEEELRWLSTQSDPALQERAKNIRNILEEKDPVKQVESYRGFAQPRQIENVFFTLLSKAIMKQKEDPEGVRVMVQNTIYQLLYERVQPALLNFYTRCEEENFVEGGLDRLAAPITKEYAREQLEERVQKKAAPLIDWVLSGQGSRDPRSISDIQLTVQIFQKDIEDYLRNPVEVWNGMPAGKEYKLLPEEQRFSDAHKEIIHKGELLMKRITANHNGTYYTKQYGLPGVNYYMYITFDAKEGKWLAAHGGAAASEYHYKDPASFSVTDWGIPGAGGAEQYNKLLADLDAINHGREP